MHDPRTNPEFIWDGSVKVLPDGNFTDSVYFYDETDTWKDGWNRMDERDVKPYWRPVTHFSERSDYCDAEAFVSAAETLDLQSIESQAYLLLFMLILGFVLMFLMIINAFCTMYIVPRKKKGKGLCQFFFNLGSLLLGSVFIIIVAAGAIKPLKE